MVFFIICFSDADIVSYTSGATFTKYFSRHLNLYLRLIVKTSVLSSD